MRITYFIEDGFVGNRSKVVLVDDTDLNECETEEEKFELIETAIQEHFQENVSWSWDRKIPKQ